MQRMLIHGEGDRQNAPYRLLPWQKEFVWRWFELDANYSDHRLPAMSPWWYTEGLVGAERGAVKTELLAGLGMVELAGPDELRGRTGTPLVICAAASLSQAGELFRQAQIMSGGAKGQEVPSAPLFGLFDVLDTQVRFADGRPGRIERIAAEAGTNEGGKTSLFLADEVAEWTGRRDRVWTVINAAVTKRTPPGRTLSISMAGRVKGHVPFTDDDPLLWRLYARGLAEQDSPHSRFLFDWRGPRGRIDLTNPDQVRTALSQMRGADVTWSVDVRCREIISRKISQFEAERLYLCRWPEASQASWLADAPGVWAECADENAVPADGTEVVVGVDMALHHDSVGVIVAGMLPDGRVGWWPRLWQADNGRIDHLDVFGTIAGSIAQRWKIRAVTYDPRFFEVPARLLEDQGILAVEFPQSPERLVAADDALYQLVVHHQLAHPDDHGLNRHAENAAWRDSERGRYLAKGRAAGNMDLIRAGSMATWELIAGAEKAAEFFVY